MKHIVPLSSIILGIIPFFFMSYYFGSFDPNKEGLGQNTTSHYAKFNNRKISGISSEIDSVIYYMKKDKQKTALHDNGLWIGNSQLHAINFFESGDLLAVEYTNLKLEKSKNNTTIYQFSAPHLNIIEELIYISEINEQSIKIKYLILPITFRSFHFRTIRDELKELSLGINNIRKITMDEQLNSIYNFERINTQKSYTEENKTWQNQSEENINYVLSKYIPLYSNRENTKSYINFLPLKTLNNLKDKSKDSKITGKEDVINLNKKALSTILEYTKQMDIKVILYQVPHPQDSSYFFYDKIAYNIFFTNMRNLVSNYNNVTFLDLSKIASINLFGVNNDGYKDVYHFRSEGHKLLGDTIAATINQLSN